MNDPAVFPRLSQWLDATPDVQRGTVDELRRVSRRLARGSHGQAAVMTMVALLEKALLESDLCSKEKH